MSSTGSPCDWFLEHSWFGMASGSRRSHCCADEPVRWAAGMVLTKGWRQHILSVERFPIHKPTRMLKIWLTVIQLSDPPTASMHPIRDRGILDFRIICATILSNRINNCLITAVKEPVRFEVIRPNINSMNPVFLQEILSKFQILGSTIRHSPSSESSNGIVLSYSNRIFTNNWPSASVKNLFPSYIFVNRSSVN